MGVFLGVSARSGRRRQLHKGILALSGLGFLYKILPEGFFFLMCLREEGSECIEEEVGPFLKRGFSGTLGVFPWNSPHSRKLLGEILFASEDKRY